MVFKRNVALTVCTMSMTMNRVRSNELSSLRVVDIKQFVNSGLDSYPVHHINAMITRHDPPLSPVGL